MLLKSTRIVATLCVALATLSSPAFGVVILRNVSPKYDKEQFAVTGAPHDGSIKFRVTRFAKEERPRDGKLVIRKDGRVVASCLVRPVEAKGRLTYVFTVSSDYISESDFFLSEGRWGKFTTIDPNNGKILTVETVAYNDVRFRFALRYFVNSADTAK